MTKIKFLHTTLWLVLLISLPFTQVIGAVKLSKEEIKMIDSLISLAFSQKRFDAAKALDNLFIAENLSTKGNYNKGIANANLSIAGIYHQNGYEIRALSLYHKALGLYADLKDTFQIAFTKQQIAQSMMDNGKPAEALALFKQSLTVYTTLNKQQDIANIKNNIGLAYLHLQKNSLAENNFRESLNISTSIKYLYGQKKANYNLGLLSIQLNNFPTAENYIQKSLVIDQILKDKYGTTLNLLQLSLIKQKVNKTDEAILIAKSAYQTAYSISAYSLLKEATIKIIDGYSLIKDVHGANKWKDSLLSILQFQSKYERDFALNFIDVIKNLNLQKSNAETEVNNARNIQKKQLLIITIGTFILIIVAVLAVLALVNYQRQRFFGKELKQKNEIIEKNSASLDQLNKEIVNQNVLLEEDIKTKNKLLSIISHDLRTPLVNTKGILNLVNQGMIPPDETEKLLQQLETQYLGTTSLLDNLLFWIKGQLNGQSDDKVKVDICQLTKNLEEEQRIPLTKKNIEIRNLIDKSIFLTIEKEMIKIVCRNLISNAIKFSKPNSLIELSVNIIDDTFFLSVKDSGIGMSKVAIEKVNSKVYYNTAGTALEKGSGFGLMLCRDLINKYNGELVIESELGKGSTFTIKMPYHLS